MAEWKLNVQPYEKSPSEDSNSSSVIQISVNKKSNGINENNISPRIEDTLRCDILRGAICSKCEECSGFIHHQWSNSNTSNRTSGEDGSNYNKNEDKKNSGKKSCTDCGCEKNEHDMPMDELMATFAMNDLNISNSRSSNEYIWVPEGLSEDMVAEYMDSLPHDKVPHINNGDGIQYYNKQLIKQIPLQDSNIENINSLSPKDKYLLDAFKREREQEMGKGVVLEADSLKSCVKCAKKIPMGDLYVNAGLLGGEATWHPGCFQCTTCNELLANLTYCHRDGQIYCLRHHAELIKPRCTMCDELIFGGEYIRTDDKAFHSSHFVCCHCEKGLSGEQHLVDQGLPICITCYDEKYASVCHLCHKIIGVDEEDVIYDDEHWHDTCLVCTICSCKLSGTSFVIKDDEFVCSDCYQKTDDKRCKTCGRGFEPGAKRLELKGEYWHDMCFKCDVCSEPITSKRFIQHEGKQVCCNCFDDKFAKRCSKCNEIMREGGVACGSAFYHRDCFACENCNTSIASQAFQQKDGRRYCTPCYKSLYAKKCSACQDYIVTGEFYSVENDNWHKECFRCEICHEVLQQQSFSQENGRIKLVCEKCIDG